MIKIYLIYQDKIINYKMNVNNQINYNQKANNYYAVSGITKDSIFDVLCENCFDILGHPKVNSLYSEILGYYCIKDGRLDSYFKKMQTKYGSVKLKTVMNEEEKGIYNRLCTCGRCRKCLSNYN